MSAERRLMLASGLMGFAFFLVANFTGAFRGSAVAAGLTQLPVNAFVFVAWYRGFKRSSGFPRAFALAGAIVPLVMASITLARVVAPWLMSLFH